MKNYIFYPVATSSPMLSLAKALKKKSKSESKYAGLMAHLARTLPGSIASLIVFIVVGLWHGANSKYLAFGLWNGLVIMFSMLLAPAFEATNTKLGIKTDSGPWHLFQILRTFIIVLIGYVFDIAPDFSSAMDMMRRMITDPSMGIPAFKSIGDMWSKGVEYLFILICAVVIFMVSRAQEKAGVDGIGEMLSRKSTAYQWIILFVLIMSIIVFGVYGPAFDPADFVYMQF